MPPHVRTNSPHVRTNWSQIWSHKPKRLPPYKRLAELIFMVPLVLNTWLPMISPPYMWTDWWIACSVWGPRLIEQSTPKYRAGPSLKGLPPLTAPYYQVPCGFWNRNLVWYVVWSSYQISLTSVSDNWKVRVKPVQSPSQPNWFVLPNFCRLQHRYSIQSIPRCTGATSIWDGV